MTYRHYVISQRHAISPLLKRHVCPCGYRSPWKFRLGEPDHPHLIATVSAKNLTPANKRIEVEQVIKHTDGDWHVTYKCGHSVHGVSDFDLARARKNHTAAECRKEAS